ncbi:bifunctional 2-keto-4-hydroxyglutarate aldolase/2-keto-3-deoxy-6-phosphogluconate aldolase [Lactiplantibacillus plajomi]|uniref:Bifunctional 2-keto-4-hydroxyglutarate aldolase/2-keto-3-deoxy-6-phosphogluconate aldolase n=1 Tax=Lactiplantibacillus plajomi TaxID=1457217 RepID=A0ABV6K029_9LACO|nr:bifunctional 2-keto-4-hydroxyglutarate aldolase/2-keto-3-deoxy-6-phosphogluconate aldolase [Lactiplantibacillus plajomi]
MTLQKFSYLKRIIEGKLVAVVRGTTKIEAKKTAEACIAGGIKTVELTFTAPHADQIISELVIKYQNTPAVIVGAGTVLDATTARIAILAGAQFIVGPSFNVEVAKLCNLYAVPYMPGCMTLTDVQTALTYGADVVKLFPGSVVGQGMVTAIHGPFPQANLMITGGVDLENMQDWFAMGASVLGIGGHLTAPSSHGDFERVTENAKSYSTIIQRIKRQRESKAIGV